MNKELAPVPKLAVSSWSFHQEFEDPVVDPHFTLEEFMRICASDLGFHAVEFLYKHLLPRNGANAHPEPDQIKRLKEVAAGYQLKIVCLAVHNDFVTPVGLDRKSDIEYVSHCIDTAHKLGAGLVRINAGISRTSTEVVPQFLESVAQVIEKTKQLWSNDSDRVRLVLENQGGITQDPFVLMDIMLRAEEMFGPDALRVCLDTGNYVAEDSVRAVKLLSRCSPPLDSTLESQQLTPSRVKDLYVKEVLKRAELITRKPVPPAIRPEKIREYSGRLDKNFIGHVHLKSYSIDPQAPPASLAMDYTHIMWQFFLSGYNGYYSIEYEGHEGYADEASYESVEKPEQDQRKKNTCQAIKNIKAMVDNTYDSYRREFGGSLE